jgi:gas vesicle protein
VSGVVSGLWSRWAGVSRDGGLIMQEKQMNHQHNSSFVLGVMAGAALGAGVALLLAPHTGAETRDQLRRLGRDAKERATHLAERGRGVAADAIRRGRRVADQVSEQVESVASSPVFSQESADFGSRRS